MKIQISQFMLAGFYPYTPIKQESMELGQKLLGCTPWIKATVPGSVYQDLLNAKLIKDPYYNMNSLLSEWVPSRWWVYITNFDKPKTNDKIYLNIEGINYKAHIFVNGKLIDVIENMFVPKKYLLEDLKEIKNELKIIIEHAPDEYGQIGYTSKTFTQKSRFDYKWDFGIRMIDTGIWRPIFLETCGDIQITDYYIRLNEDEKIQLSFNLDKSLNDTSVELELFDNNDIVYNGIIQLDESKLSYDLDFKIDNLKLWTTHDIKQPFLYRMVLKVKIKDSVSQVIDEMVGFRHLKFLQNKGTVGKVLPYTLKLNNQIIYMKGVNIVPLDMMMGTVTKDRYEKLVKQLVYMNVNIVRIWGGGMIAPKEFYDLCDHYGILIWQDFIQSSSGIDNYPSHLSTFIEKFTDTVEYTTKSRRNHASLAAFCGGNELMFPNWKPVDLTVPNIKLMYDIIQKNCPEIMFYPSTPSGETFSINFENQSMNHDVHGDWRYLGVEKHYSVPNQTINMLHSEFGVNGMSDWSTLKKTMPSELLTVNQYKDGIEWRHRSEWWNTYEREKIIFGEIDELEDHVYLSQFIQSEGLRYVIDANRRNYPYQSGCIIWQVNEPFPNGSCTSLIDYYGNPKLVYYSVRESFNQIALSLKYDKLMYEPNELCKLDLFAISDKDDNINYEVSIYADNQYMTSYKGSTSLNEKETLKLNSISIKIPLNAYTLFIQMKATTEDNKVFENHVLLLINQNDKKALQERVIKYVKKMKLKYESLRGEHE